MSDAEKILILNVDDYAAGRYARTQVLQRAGFEVKEASTGGEAIRLTAVDHPGVVLLDVNLPDISGFEVCRRIKTNPATASVPVLHLSATFVTAGHRTLGLEGGADGYLTEPVEPSVLVATVNALLRMRRAEERARQLARQWQTSFDAICDGVAVLNAGGSVLQCNQAFARLFDRPVEKLIGTPVNRLWGVPPERAREMPFGRLLTSQRRETAELQLGQRWFRVAADPVRDEDGLLLGCVYTVHDVTEHRQAEQERAELLGREQAARAEAEAANRAKDEFVATVSHELRAPLTAILGWTKMLRRGILDRAASDHALETIERNIDVQVRLIDDLLDVSRIVTGRLRLDLRPVDLPAVIHGALEAVRPAAEAKAIRIEEPLDATAGVVFGDAGRLQQVVSNLLSNAVKFTPNGGRVQVRLEWGDAEARIIVRDTGQGISPEFLPYVFDRFRQAETSPGRSHGGLGLGLAIVRHLVELHGGTVQAASPGLKRGATFTVTIPVRPPGLEMPAAVPLTGDVAGLPTLAGVRVLVVEDEEDARALLEAALRERGAEVVTAASTDEALTALEQSGADVVVSDIAMPGMDGYELLRRIRALSAQRGGEIPAIALTAYTREQGQDAALAAGYQVHVAKPVDPTELARAVARLVRRQ